MACLSDEEVAALLEGQLPPEQHARALEHIDGCAPCRELVAQAGLEEDAAPLAPGSLLGRYVILGVLGAGAMARGMHGAPRPQGDLRDPVRPAHPLP